MVHSALCGVGDTVDALRGGGLRAEVTDRLSIPFGPVLRSRTAFLGARGLIAPDEKTEELVVVRAEHSS